MMVVGGLMEGWGGGPDEGRRRVGRGLEEGSEEGENFDPCFATVATRLS